MDTTIKTNTTVTTKQKQDTANMLTPMEWVVIGAVITFWIVIAIVGSVFHGTEPANQSETQAQQVKIEAHLEQ